MRSNERIKQIISNPKLLFFTLGHRGFLNWMSDKEYLKIAYRIKIGEKLDLDTPKTFNEKLQWLKLYDRNPMYTKMVDKYEVKKYVSSIIGEEYIIPTLGVWANFDDIDFDRLPNQYVMKCTHDSGGLVICRDKKLFNIKNAKKKINTCLKNNFFWASREWPYKNVKPRIIAEEYLQDSSQTTGLNDYKLMCFNGKVKCSFVCTNRFGNGELYVNFYDRDWKPMPFIRQHPRNPEEVKKPNLYLEMVALSEKLSMNIPFVRVDWYECGGKLYFGELTFYPGSGMEWFDPKEWDLKLGNLLKLPYRENEG